MFPSPWASNAEFERKYCDLLKNIFDLNMDHMTTSLLTMMALFNTSISELEYPEVRRNYIFLTENKVWKKKLNCICNYMVGC